MHVSEAASKNATSTRFVDVLVRKSERAPGKAIAKRPDCPAKVDNREIVLFEIFTRGLSQTVSKCRRIEASVDVSTRCNMKRTLLYDRERLPSDRRSHDLFDRN